MTTTAVEPEAIAALIHEAGGLVNIGQLAKRWGYSRQHVAQLARRADWPVSVGEIGGRSVYLAGPCDEWRRMYAAGEV